MQVIMLTLYARFNSDSVYRASFADIQHTLIVLGGEIYAT